LVRVGESTATAVAYYQLGLFTAESDSLFLLFIPCVVVGVPLGAYLIRHLDAETFRRICMSFDAWVVGFGLSRVLIDLELAESPWAYGVMAATMVIDLCLLYIFFTARNAAAAPSQTAAVLRTGSGGTDHPIRSPRTPSDDHFEDLNLLLGYIIAIAVAGMLLYTLFPAIRP